MKRLTTLCVIAALSACGGPRAEDDSNNAVFRVELDDTAARAAATDLMAALRDGDFSVFTAPTVIGDFDCFAASITGAGILPNSGVISSCSTTSNFGGAGIGSVSNMGQRGTPLTVSVSAGSSRRIGVFGLYPKPQECGGSASSFDMYALGSKTIDISDDATVTIPITFSNTSVGTCTGGSSAISLSPSQAYKDSAGTCVATAAASGAPTTVTVSSVANSASIDNSGDGGDCYNSASTPYHNTDFYFGGNGLSGKTSITITWRGRGGTMGAGYSYGTALTAPGATVRLYTGSSTWSAPLITSTDITASQYQTFSATTAFNTTMLHGTCPSCSVVVRVSGASAGSTNYSVSDTDYINVSLQ